MKILVLYCYKNIANIGLNAFLYIRVIWRFYAVSGKLAKVRRTVAQISSPSAPAKNAVNLPFTAFDIYGRLFISNTWDFLRPVHNC